MMERTALIMRVTGAIVAVVLQIVVAPYIAIGFAFPDFILAFVVVAALLNPMQPGYIMPFVVGLIFDLVGGGTLGAMAFVCVLITFAISRAFMLLNNDSLFIPLALCVFGCFIAEIVYGSLLILCGMDVSFLEALLYRMLPCGLYDTVICLIAYPILMRILSAKNTIGDVSILN